MVPCVDGHHRQVIERDHVLQCLGINCKEFKQWRICGDVVLIARQYDKMDCIEYRFRNNETMLQTLHGIDRICTKDKVKSGKKGAKKSKPDKTLPMKKRTRHLKEVVRQFNETHGNSSSSEDEGDGINTQRDEVTSRSETRPSRSRVPPKDRYREFLEDEPAKKRRRKELESIDPDECCICNDGGYLLLCDKCNKGREMIGRKYYCQRSKVEMP